MLKQGYFQLNLDFTIPVKILYHFLADLNPQLKFFKIEPLFIKSLGYFILTDTVSNRNFQFTDRHKPGHTGDTRTYRVIPIFNFYSKKIFNIIYVHHDFTVTNTPFSHNLKINFGFSKYYARQEGIQGKTNTLAAVIN